MNILLITHEKNINGASKALLAMVDIITNEKHKVFVLTPFFDGDMVQELKKRRIETINFGFHRWIVDLGENKIKRKSKRIINCIKIVYDYLNLTKLISILKKYDLDIVHTNTSVICIGAWISKKMNIPHVWHLREFGFEDFNMTPVLSEKFTWNYMSNNATIFIAISRAIYKKYEKLIDSSKIRIIYDGVKIPEHVYLKNIHEKSTINLLLVGRLSETKGHLDAIRALKRLNEITTKRYYLYLAGNGNQNFIRTDPVYESVKDQVIFCGYLQDMDKMRQSIDIELMCSRSEGFGLVTVEAMMFGHPVIGTNVGGTTELIKDGWNGFFYSRGNYEELAIKIIETSKNEIYKKMSQNALEFAKKSFTDDKNAKKIISIYQEIRFKDNYYTKGSLR